MLYTRLCEKIVSRHGGDTEASRREAWGTVGSLTGIAANLLLSLIKFAVGLSTGSVAATADAANNLSDAGGSIMSLATATRRIAIPLALAAWNTWARWAWAC